MRHDRPVRSSEPVEATIVADTDRAVGPDRRAIGPADELGDDLGLPQRERAGERTATDLEEHDRCVAHGDCFGNCRRAVTT